MRQATLPLCIAVLLTACTSTAERQYEQAQGIIKEHLKAPSTATFTPFSEVERSTNGNGDDLFKFWCEAQNEMGVPIRKKAFAGFDPKNGEMVFVTYGADDLFLREKEKKARQAELDSIMEASKAETEAWVDSIYNAARN